MFSVFSKKLFEFHNIVEGSPMNENCKLADTVDSIRTALRYSTALATVGSDIPLEDVECIYNTLLENNELSRVIYWTNEKILMQIDHISYKTLGVRLRIATGMLNKAIYNCKIDPKIGIIIHDNFTKNLMNVHNDLINETLPF